MARPSRLPFALIALLLLAVLVAAPAAAAILPEYQAIDPVSMENVAVVQLEGVTTLDISPYETGQCIIQVVFETPPDSQVDFTLYAGQQTITGSMNVSDDESISRVFGWSLGEESFLKERLRVLNQVGGEYQIRVWTDSIYREDRSGQMYAGLSEFVRGPTGIAYAPLNTAISRITVTASEPIDVDISTIPTEQFYKAYADQVETISLVDYLFKTIGGLLVINPAEAIESISFTWMFFSQIFIKNFYALIALYVTITGAVAVCTKRDIFKALEEWIGYQVSLLKFMLEVGDTIISVFTRIINALKPL